MGFPHDVIDEPRKAQCIGTQISEVRRVPIHPGEQLDFPESLGEGRITLVSGDLQW